MKYAELRFTAEKLVLQKKIRKIKQSEKDYYISGVKVRNNVITTAGHGII